MLVLCQAQAQYLMIGFELILMPKLQRNHYCLFIWHDEILGVRLCFQAAQVPKHILLPTRPYSNSYTLWSRTSIQEIILSTHYMSSTALGTEDRTVIQKSKNTYPNRVYILATIFLICVCVCVHVRYLVFLNDLMAHFQPKYNSTTLLQ